MKNLYIVRHAKSSWEEEGLSDFDRPLNERGKRDAPAMAKRLKEKDVTPDLMLSSPAKRAFSTARRMAKVLGYSKEKIKTDRRLYHADAEMIISVLQELKSRHNTVLLFGHNPGLTDFVNTMMSENRQYIDNVPTCGIVAFSLAIDEWKELKSKKGKMFLFDYPKNTGD
jgi:phosphohistidine phosphatase